MLILALAIRLDVDVIRPAKRFAFTRVLKNVCLSLQSWLFLTQTLMLVKVAKKAIKDHGFRAYKTESFLIVKSFLLFFQTGEPDFEAKKKANYKWKSASLKLKQSNIVQKKGLFDDIHFHAG